MLILLSFCFCLLQINMMLANLYKKAGQERPSVTSYKEVLRQCPLALDAILGTDHSQPISLDCLLSEMVVLTHSCTLESVHGAHGWLSWKSLRLLILRHKFKPHVGFRDY